jgi:outer membrane protein assembly factor BamE
MMTKSVIASLLLISLAGCAGWRDSVGKLNPVDSIKPYQADIQQGNLVTQDQLATLKPGMTPAQVRFLLGSPLIVDPFHKDRWDYAYSLQRGKNQIERRHVTILFENDRLKAVQGDVVPAAVPAPAPAPAAEAAKP